MDPTAEVSDELRYAKRFINRLAATTDLHAARRFWRQETVNMAKFGILGTAMEKELRAAWIAHGNALARAANNPNAPAN